MIGCRMRDLLWSIGTEMRGPCVLTVYEGEKSATVELSRELAAQLAAALADHGKDGDGCTSLELAPPVLTQEELDGLD